MTTSELVKYLEHGAAAAKAARRRNRKKAEVVRVVK